MTRTLTMQGLKDFIFRSEIKIEKNVSIMILRF